MTASDNLSPCLRMCCLDDENICLGCFRSLDEIRQWRELTTQQRQEILNTVNVRKLTHKI